MLNKLHAIWKIIISEHYLVLTGSGGVSACYPATDTTHIIKNIAEAVNKAIQKVKDEADHEKD